MRFSTNTLKLFLTISIFSFSFCKSDLTDKQQCLETSEKLIHYFKTKDTTRIAKLIGMSDLKSAGKDMSFIYDECEELDKQFDMYGIPTKDSFEFNTYPNDFINRYIVTILIKNPASNKLESKIEIYFAPKNIIPLTKISTYQIIPILENLNLSPPTNN